MLQMNTGKILSGSPCLGSWVNYGLGTVNQNLPGFCVMLDQTGGRAIDETGEIQLQQAGVRQGSPNGGARQARLMQDRQQEHGAGAHQEQAGGRERPRLGRRVEGGCRASRGTQQSAVRKEAS